MGDLVTISTTGRVTADVEPKTSTSGKNTKYVQFGLAVNKGYVFTTSYRILLPVILVITYSLIYIRIRDTVSYKWHIFLQKKLPSECSLNSF